MRYLALGLLLALAACSNQRVAVPRTPAKALDPLGTLRQTPPPDLERTAAALRSRAPTLDLVASSGLRWSLAEAGHRPALLVFFRGHW